MFYDERNLQVDSIIMAGNTFGTLFKVTTFGETHGGSVGCIIDGCPSGLALSEEDIQKDLLYITKNKIETFESKT